MSMSCPNARHVRDFEYSLPNFRRVAGGVTSGRVGERDLIFCSALHLTIEEGPISSMYKRMGLFEITIDQVK